ncbi:TetR/AcrR family transcriptional regulator [Actinoplanes couchii]|uniref:HTH tetR-type domain-containing protein n=1 Tax=Actinoplanes couchii TaxID=403638 RepID=A0ABQ3XMN6_9ACTN|nr:helix-turn-helix domain-containing protein [Actinoplanes couchii]MDR6317788.1 AcrR family transcriptional regulator [Actinoplanes couchii]GID59777.1 hypothetical protein Aco03nite_081810 [Actinoplanes couchii]
MGNREDLLDAAKRCLYDKGYARTTARDVAAAAGVSLAAIGYHFGTKELLLNAALRQALEEWGDDLARVLNTDHEETPAPGTRDPATRGPAMADSGSAGLALPGAGATDLGSDGAVANVRMTGAARVGAGVGGAGAAERFAVAWDKVIASFVRNEALWAVQFEIIAHLDRTPELRTAFSQAGSQARLGLVELFQVVVPAGLEEAAGTLLQAMLGGLAAQWLVDPRSAPTGAELVGALLAIAEGLTAGSPAEGPTTKSP